jgi:sulfur-carrier protein
MARVTFTPNLQRHVACPPADAPGGTVREVLDAAFAGNERARGYVLDEHGALRKHMLVFVNGEQILDRDRLSDPVPAGAEVYVMQALSGGQGRPTPSPAKEIT